MRNVIITVFFFVCCFQTSCDRCSNMPIHQADLTDCEQFSVPYKGDEVLRFLSNGDTLSLKGNGVLWANERASSAGGDCAEEFLLSVKKYNFSNPDYTLIMKRIPNYGNNSAELFITDISQHKQLVRMEIAFCNGKPTLDYPYLKYNGHPSDSITILGKTYYNVYGDENRFAYNLSEGILKFSDWGVSPNYTIRYFERIQ